MKASLWSADWNQVVHLRNCAAAGPGTSPYMNSAADADTLVASLARPDTSNGHSAPSALHACPDCIAPLLENAHG